MSGLLLAHVRGGADAGDLNTAQHTHANGQGCLQIQESSVHIYTVIVSTATKTFADMSH